MAGHRRMTVIATMSDRLARSSNARAMSAANVALFVLLTLGYWIAAGQIAAVRPYWMDEVLAVWTARLPTVAAIWDALNKGAEFSPPLYHLFLQKIIQLGGDGPLPLRLPSILSVYLVGLCAFVLIRRRYPVPVALLAMALCLSSSLFLFAVQMRQYAPVAACFALALVLWDTPADKASSWRRALGICLLLAAAVGMHFYAVLLAAAVGLMELVWTAVHRRIRWLYIVFIGFACLSVFLWLRILQSVASFNSGDTSAPEYYARPIANLLPTVYAFLMLGPASIVLSPLTVLAAAAVVTIVFRLTRGTARRGVTPDNLNIIVWVTCATPLLIFLFAFLITHAFNVRYVIAATIGLALLTAQLVAQMAWANAISYAGVAIAAFLSLQMIVTGPSANRVDRALALVERAPPGLRIATGDGLRFFELREGATAGIASRLVYVKSPAGTASPDPTNEHQVERWTTIDPTLSVTGLAPFLAAHPRFLLFSDPGAIDLLPGQLAARGYTIIVIARDGDATLAEVSTPR